jgi:hypothetical protein
MQLWQLDVMGSVLLADGTECKLVSGVDDHSRFCVIAQVVSRATGRAVCQAFADALLTYGCPEQVLTDNGRQFTGKYGRPRPAEVLFDRICRRNGIEHLLTKVRSPTTTGKVERWHQSIQRELLAEHGPFESLQDARAAVAAWREEYNTRRPHQALGMASPADRFRAAPPSVLPVWLPGELTAVQLGIGGDEQPQPAFEPVPVVEQSAPALDLTTVPAGEAVQVDRVVPASGNMAVGPQQFWIGRARAGMTVSLWIDTRTVHLSLHGRYYKTLPSRFSSVDLARLRADGGRPAGPAPARPSSLGLATTATVEVERLVNGCGLVALAGTRLQVGSPLAGRQVTLRIEEHLVHVITDGQVRKTIPHTVPPAKRARLRGAYLPAPMPTPSGDPVRVQRRVSSRGGIQVISQRVQVGFGHRNTIVTVEIDETVLRLFDEHDKLIKVMPRTSHKEVSRYKAYAPQNRAKA